jgi:hypothetical protein
VEWWGGCGCCSCCGGHGCWWGGHGCQGVREGVGWSLSLGCEIGGLVGGHGHWG